MRPRISPRRMSKMTSWSEVSLSTSAPSISCSGICGSLLGLVSSIFDLCGSSPARHQALGSEDHHQHQRQAEGEGAPLLELAEPLGEVGEQERTDEDADDVARATDDHHGHEQERQVEHERVGLDVLLLAAEQQPGQAADGRADREGPQLELEARHAHDGRGVLVLADGQPGTADAAVLETTGQPDDDDEDHQRQPVPALGVDRVEGRPPVDLRAGGHGDLGDARGTAGDGVEVASGDADDLAEPEGHDREVVTAQPQGGSAEDDARRERHRDGDRDAHGEGDRPVVGQPEARLQRLHHRRRRRPEQGHRVGAEGVEADVAEVEEPREPDHHVEPDGHDHVDDDQEQHARPVRAGGVQVGADVGERQDVEERQVEGEGDDQQQADGTDPLGSPVPAVPQLEAAVGVEELAHARAFPRDSPSSPVGRNIRTRTRTMNAVTSVQLESQTCEAYTSTTPRSRPPTRAPRRLPMPPRTAAVNALMPMMKPMSNLVMSYWMVNRSAATPAIAPPRTKTSMMTRSWLTPIRDAVSGSCATARTPRPRRLLFTKVSSATIITIAPMMMSSRVLVTGRSRPGMVKTTLVSSTDGTLTVTRPKGGPKKADSTWPKVSTSTIEQPMPVMRKMRGGAPFLRSGR